MLPSKVKLTSEVIDAIKAARIKKQIPAATLSKAIKRDSSYISSLELGRLRTINSVDLVAILRFLFDIPEQEAVAKAETFAGMGAGKSPDGNSGRDKPYSSISVCNNGIYRETDGEKDRGDYDKDYATHMGISVCEPDAVNRYEVRADYADPELISDMLGVITGLIIDFYKKNPKEAVFGLKSFIETMQFDPGFTMGIMSIPFFALRTLSADGRKAVLNDILETFDKHASAARLRT